MGPRAHEQVDGSFHAARQGGVERIFLVKVVPTADVHARDIGVAVEELDRLPEGHALPEIVVVAPGQHVEQPALRVGHLGDRIEALLERHPTQPFGRVRESLHETPRQDGVSQCLFAGRGDHQGDRQRVHQQGTAVTEAVLVIVGRGLGVED